MSGTAPKRRVHIDRIDLDLRGLSPAKANEAARALGPALARALAGSSARMASAERIDAGTIRASPAAEAHALGAAIATCIARKVGGEGG
jgi:hypothetical protein